MASNMAQMISSRSSAPASVRQAPYRTAPTTNVALTAQKQQQLTQSVAEPTTIPIDYAKLYGDMEQFSDVIYHNLLSVDTNTTVKKFLVLKLDVKSAKDR